MGTLVEQLSNCCDYFLRLSGFPNLSGKMCLITFKFSKLEYSTIFRKSNVNKTVWFLYLVSLKYREITVKLYFFGIRKKAPEKVAPSKITTRKYAPRKIAPPGQLLPKNCYTRFFLLLKLSYDFSLNLSIVTSFRGVSRTPATSIIDLLVTVVNGIN